MKLKITATAVPKHKDTATALAWTPTNDLFSAA
jgi:hypothetical protein